ncbi:hypothetical protein C8R46DRAFT_1074490 [Mycena filopes]|nr:hypothetical protein C8R46DRAFT_1074490 [Mycena filopes]
MDPSGSGQLGSIVLDFELFSTFWSCARLVPALPTSCVVWRIRIDERTTCLLPAVCLSVWRFVRFFLIRARQSLFPPSCLLVLPFLSLYSGLEALHHPFCLAPTCASRLVLCPTCCELTAFVPSHPVRPGRCAPVRQSPPSLATRRPSISSRTSARHSQDIETSATRVPSSCRAANRLLPDTGCLTLAGNVW